MLCNCNIYPLKSLAEKEYKIEHLDLFNSYYPKDIKYLNSEGLDKTVSIMAKTSLKDSLKSVHITEYKNIDKGSKVKDEQELFNRYEFHCKVISDNTWTRPAGTEKTDKEYQEW